VSNLNSNYYQNNYLFEIYFMFLSYSSRVLNIPIFRCDDQILKTVIKRENIDKEDPNNDNQIFNRAIKQERMDEINHKNDDRLIQIG